MSSPLPLRKVKLNNGKYIPVLGFGTGTSQAWTDTTPVVSTALSLGLNHMDCAHHYKNQHYTGAAIRASGLKREDVWVTTKAGSFEGNSADFDAWWYIKENLRDLGLDYVDLFLIHADILVGSVTKAWKQMEEIHKAGLARSIGVSNFSTDSLQQVLDMCEIPPAINQIEFHPYSLPTYLPTLLPLCRQHGILIEAYAPLMSVWRHPGGPLDEVVRQVAKERGKGESEGQVLLMWSQQTTGGVVLTTTTKAERMMEQAGPFREGDDYPPLSEGHMDMITKAGDSAPFRFWGTNWPYFMKGEGGRMVCPEDATYTVKPAKRAHSPPPNFKAPPAAA